MRRRPLYPVLGMLLALCGCAGTGPTASLAGLDERPAVELTEVPFHPQQRYQCGPAALATMLGWSGADTSPETLADRLYIPARQGSLQPELMAQARQHGRLVYRIPAEPHALLDELQAGHPVLVLQNLGLRSWPVWHYAVVIGYEPERGELILRSGTIRRHRVRLATFLRTWKRGDSWGVVTLRPGQLPASAEPRRYLAAAFDLEASGFGAPAETAYRAGIERWPSYPGLRLALANRRLATAGPAAAVPILEQGIAAGAEDGALYNNLALLLAELERWDEAEIYARRAVRAGGPHLDEFRNTLDEICRRRPTGRCAPQEPLS